MIRPTSMILLGLAIIIMTQSFLFAGMAGAASQPVNDMTLIVQENGVLKSRIVDLENRINSLGERLNTAENKSNNMQTRSTVGAVSLLFGAFCALWAQNTRRNAFGWFVLGAMGTVFTALAVLWNNHYDITHPPSTFD